MKNVNYFGHQFSVPDWAKYIAMDGKRNCYNVYAFNYKPGWCSASKGWILEGVGLQELVTVNKTYLRSQTKPKNSLMEIHKNG